MPFFSWSNRERASTQPNPNPNPGQGSDPSAASLRVLEKLIKKMCRPPHTSKYIWYFIWYDLWGHFYRIADQAQTLPAPPSARRRPSVSRSAKTHMKSELHPTKTQPLVRRPSVPFARTWLAYRWRRQEVGEMLDRYSSFGQRFSSVGAV